MYKLMGSLKTRAFRVMWMLNELGLEFEVDPVPPRDPALIAINPSGKVPVLIDGADAIIDSVAICQYLADKHGHFTFPAGTVKRGQQDSFTQFAMDDIEGPLWTAAKHTFVLPKELRVEDVKKACRWDFERAIGVLSQRLGDREFVMGETFTVLDLLLGHCGGWAKAIGWEIPDGKAGAYFDRIRERPAYLKSKAQRDGV